MKEGKKEMLYVTTNSTHFIYCYMVFESVNDFFLTTPKYILSAGIDAKFYFVNYH